MLLEAMMGAVQGSREEKLGFCPVPYFFSLESPRDCSHTGAWSARQEKIPAPKLDGLCKLPPRT